MSVKVDQLSEPGEYDDAMLTLLQVIWGDGFLSPGGAPELARLLEGSEIAGCSVLDIGCGLGAIDALLVTDYGARSVVGIDIDPALIASMNTRIARAGLADRVEGKAVGGGALPFPANSFDVVFSKDAIVQIPDKAAMFAEVLRVLRPGGRFIASDWLRGGTGPYSPAMLEFFRLEGITYNMATLAESAASLRAVGFTTVDIRDRHAWYRELAHQELAAMEGPLKEVITARIGQQRTAHFIEDWRQLVLVVDRGELRPGHLKASKPESPIR
ncbi:MAG: methyltransferase domain-containing protein [Steroidobacteraceae bacterium]|jgi:phosphoethanolamine N-methyltransferase